MKPREFFERFTALCGEFYQVPQQVFRHLPFDELDWLQEGSPNSWDCLRHCLNIWSQPGFVFDEAHESAYPDITCLDCRHYTSLSRWCGRYEKAIPINFNLKNACKDWNV